MSEEVDDDMIESKRLLGEGNISLGSLGKCNCAHRGEYDAVCLEVGYTDPEELSA